MNDNTISLIEIYNCILCILQICELLGKYKKRALAVFSVVLEAASFLLDIYGKSKRRIDTTLFERVQAPICGEKNLQKEKRDRGIAEKRKKTKLKKDKMIYCFLISLTGPFDSTIYSLFQKQPRTLN